MRDQIIYFKSLVEKRIPNIRKSRSVGFYGMRILPLGRFMLDAGVTRACQTIFKIKKSATKVNPTHLGNGREVAYIANVID
jgi:hypothetical protein